MAKAFDELKKLNEDHKTIQQKNLSLFEGVKDREIADLKKSLAGWQEAVSVRDQEIARQKQMLDMSEQGIGHIIEAWLKRFNAAL
ncbi:MAG: hypothetical protein ACKOCK_12085, partial [Chloroflexota bacterium]